MKNFFIILFVGFSIGAFAQKSDYTISGKIEGLKDTAVYIANYYGNKLYYNDTTQVDSKGRFSFEGKPFDEGGKYAFVIPGPKYFDFIIADEDIVFESTVKDLSGDLVFVKSENNIIFYDYIKYINDKRKLRQPYDLILKDSTITDEGQKKAAKDAIIELNDEVVTYQKNLVEKHKDKLVGKMINMTMEVVIPDAPESVEDTNRWKYYWYRSHYWDNVDLSDNRLVRDQSFDRIITKYITEVIPQIPDSVCAEADRMLSIVEDKPDLFKYILHKFTFSAESSKIMCMDKAFVCLIDKYYKTGKASWMTDDKLAEIIEASDKKKTTLCGEIAPNVILPDTTSTNWVNLHEIEAEYTIVAIWESTCGHCKKEMPKLLDLANKYEKDGVVFFAIGNEQPIEPWIKFVKEKELGAPNWINVSDNLAIDEPDSARTLIMAGITTLESLNFRKSYNVTSTPQVLLLDKNKKILAKQLTAEQIGEFLDKWMAGESEEDSIPIIEQEIGGEDEKPNKTKKSKQKKNGS